jgi:hypothetical protein
MAALPLVLDDQPIFVGSLGENDDLTAGRRPVTWGIKQTRPKSLLELVRLVELAQSVRFLVLELIYLVLNFRFNMDVIFMINYFFSGRRCLRRQRDALSDQLRESQG